MEDIYDFMEKRDKERIEKANVRFIVERKVNVGHETIKTIKTTTDYNELKDWLTRGGYVINNNNFEQWTLIGAESWIG